MDNKIRFGTAGMSDKMREDKLSYIQVSELLTKNGLLCYEYPFTHGTNITEEKCVELGEIFKVHNVSLSVHAPYFINLATNDDEKKEKTFGYLYNSMRKAKIMGADRVVFHPGSLTGQSREMAFANTLNNFKEFLQRIKDVEEVSGVFLCPETMGKHGQIGTVEEIAKLCELADIVIPTLDFGHINSFNGGSLKTEQSFHEILDVFIKSQNKKEIHVHFSKIEYGAKGEIKHLCFNSDFKNFGPDYKIFVDSLKKYDVNIRVVCESAGMQDTDAKIMLDYFKK